MIYPQESWDQPFYCTFSAIYKKKVSEGAVKCHANQPLAWCPPPRRDVEATSPTRRSVTKVQGSLLHFAFQKFAMMSLLFCLPILQG